MKKTAILLILMLALSGCTGKVNVDELISARELPEYSPSVEIEINDTETENTETTETDGEVIVIE